MTEHQHDLFGAAPAARAQAAPPARRLARRENPPTSHAAAEQAPAFASEHHDTILRVMRSHGGRGLTVHEMAAYCRLEAHAIGKRVAELERGGADARRHGRGRTHRPDPGQPSRPAGARLAPAERTRGRRKKTRVMPDTSARVLPIQPTGSGMMGHRETTRGNAMKQERQ